jgi:hypothetical protein
LRLFSFTNEEITMLQWYVLTCGRSVTAFSAPPQSQRPGQGPRSPHPKVGPASMHKWATTLVVAVQVDMTKLVGVNLASSHTCQDSSGQSYSMGTSLLSGPKYHIIRTPAMPTGKAQDGETAVLVYSFSVSLVCPSICSHLPSYGLFLFLVSSFQLWFYLFIWLGYWWCT